MFVAASTACFADLELHEAFERLVDLEYTAAEIVIGDYGKLLKPEFVRDNVEQAAALCRQSRRVPPIAYFFDVEVGEENYFEDFHAVCKLAKATKVVTVAIHASKLGTPFNEEVERLRDLVDIAKREGVVVGLITETGRMTIDPDSIGILCKSIPGLGITLDPSHFIYNTEKEIDYENIIEHVCHVRLRDSKKDALQVRVGQGLLEYGKVVTQLQQVKYQRALCVDLHPMADVNQHAELRKMRLLLESLL